MCDRSWFFSQSKLELYFLSSTVFGSAKTQPKLQRVTHTPGVIGVVVPFSPVASTMLPSVCTTISVAFWELRLSPIWSVVLPVCINHNTSVIIIQNKTKRMNGLFWPLELGSVPRVHQIKRFLTSTCSGMEAADVTEDVNTVSSPVWTSPTVTAVTSWTRRCFKVCS